MSYNMTFPAPSISNLNDYGFFLNIITGNLFWTLSIFFIWIFFFIGLIFVFDMLRSFGWSSFITSILSLILVSMGLISNSIVVFFIVVTAISVTLSYFKGGG